MRSLDCRSLLLLLRHMLREEGIVFRLLLLLAFDPVTLERAQVATTLKADGGDQPLDFGGLSVRLSTLLLGARHLSSNNVFPHIILLGQVEELPDLGRPLGTETLRENSVGESGNLIVTLLDDDKRENGNIGTDDAATNGFALALTGAAGTVARVTVGEEEADTVGEENTLLHRETLFVVATSDTENIAFPLITERISCDLLSNSLVVEDTVFSLIIIIDGFLFPSCGVGNVELHALA